MRRLSGNEIRNEVFSEELKGCSVAHWFCLQERPYFSCVNLMHLALTLSSSSSDRCSQDVMLHCIMDECCFKPLRPNLVENAFICMLKFSSPTKRKMRKMAPGYNNFKLIFYSGKICGNGVHLVLSVILKRLCITAQMKTKSTCNCWKSMEIIFLSKIIHQR